MSGSYPLDHLCLSSCGNDFLDSAVAEFFSLNRKFLLELAAAQDLNALAHLLGETGVDDHLGSNGCAVFEAVQLTWKMVQLEFVAFKSVSCHKTSAIFLSC